MTTSTNPITQAALQLSLFAALDADDLGDIDKPHPIDPLAGWGRTGVRALTMDPSVEMRLLAARSHWNRDAEIQHCLATDPDERVVLALLASVDLPAELQEQLRHSPHAAVRAAVAQRYGSEAALAA